MLVDAQISSFNNGVHTKGVDSKYDEHKDTGFETKRC
jgi:hypothetical protein